MNFYIRSISACFALVVPVLAQAAEDGKLLFTQMCASCHGMNGEGVGNGAFPPLKDSEWLKGEPQASQRVAQILLHGLTGPIEVKGREYNLVMPAQGALSDEQKIAVIQYITKEFVGEDSTFSAKDLATAKNVSKGRAEAWEAQDLLKKYPLARKASSIGHLISTLYHGKWKQMPDFSKLESVAVEEEQDGYISLSKINRKDNFAVVWTGDFKVPSDGDYEFHLQSDDGSAVYIDDKLVTQVKGTGGISAKRTGKAKVALTKGIHRIRVDYFEATGGEVILLKWKDSKAKKDAWEWLSDKANQPSKATPVIDLTPSNGETRMYLNFIAGSTARTMGVGYPHNQNIAFSLQDCQPDLIWKGRFISAGRHWTARGQGAQEPLSNQVVKLGSGVAWSQDGKDLAVQLVGYTMDKTGNPTFRYKSDGLEFSEKYISSKGGLTRQITIVSVKDQALVLRLSKGKLGKLRIQAENSVAEADKLVLPVNVKKGKNTLSINYSWE